INSFSRARQRAPVVVALTHVQAEPDGRFGCRITHSILPGESSTVAGDDHDTRCWHPRYKETWTLIRPGPYSQATYVLETRRQPPPDHQRQGEVAIPGPATRSPAGTHESM